MDEQKEVTTMKHTMKFSFWLIIQLRGRQCGNSGLHPCHWRDGFVGACGVAKSQFGRIRRDELSKINLVPLLSHFFDPEK